jgi:hypothetical protein
MAKAFRSLSPKQILERVRLHRQAVMILVHRRAKKAVERELRARAKAKIHRAKGDQPTRSRLSRPTSS